MRTDRRRKLLVVLSVAMAHGLVFLCSFFSLSGAGAIEEAGNEDAGGGVLVSLVKGDATTSAAASEASALENLMARMKPTIETIPVSVRAPKSLSAPSSPTDLDELMGRYDPSSGKTDAAKGDPGGARTKSDVLGQGGSKGLWGQVEPCWKRGGGAARAAVSLKLEFSADGRLSRPPVIERPAGAAADEARLAAEARAIAAVAACGPYDLLAGGYELKFPKQ